MLSVKGTFLNGVACPSTAVQGRDGEAVIITFVAEKAHKLLRIADDAAWDSLSNLVAACAVDTGVPDLAEQHGHYIHGKPRDQ